MKEKPPRHVELEALAERRLPTWTFAAVSKAVDWPQVVTKPSWPTQQQVLDQLELALAGDFSAACAVLRWYRVLGTPESEAQQDVVAQLSLAFTCLGTATSPHPPIPTLEAP